MRALLTGGAGFVGSHLADALLAQGHEVMVVDDLSTGSMDNIVHLKGRPGFEYVIDTVMNEPLTAELIDRADVVFHLAAAVGVKLIVEAPVRTIETNVHGTEIVLKHGAKKGKLTMIFSTSEVYGKSTNVPFGEDSDLVMGPTPKHRWACACSKAIDEFLALAYHRERRLPVVVARLFNTVGPRQTGRYGMVIPNFVRQALVGEPITVHGDGTQTRSFTFVGDVVRGLIALSQEPRAVGQVFNIGNTEEVSILELAKRVRAATKSQSEIVFIPYDQAYESGFEDMPRRVPDLTKIHGLVGYAPRWVSTTSCGESSRTSKPCSPGSSAIIDRPCPDPTCPQAAERLLLANAKPCGGCSCAPAATARPDGPTSSRSRAPTCATRSASSALATRCTGARA
jgi:UDP-glucose 4-epimerase